MVINIGIAAIGSFLASLGFAILFNIKGNHVYIAGIAGAIGGVIYKTSLLLGCSEFMAMFFASIGFSIYSEILARVCKTPVTTYIVCALIPLVPGGGMYQTMLQAIKGDMNQALATGFQTLSTAGVLVSGILIVSTLMRTIYRRRKIG